MDPAETTGIPYSLGNMMWGLLGDPGGRMAGSWEGGLENTHCPIVQAGFLGKEGSVQGAVLPAYISAASGDLESFC